MSVAIGAVSVALHSASRGTSFVKLTPGTRLGPYQLETAAGAGGMGEVYRARDTRLDPVVAITVLPAALAQDPLFRERFAREARAISQLDHPRGYCTFG